MIALLLFRDVQWIKTNEFVEFYWYDWEFSLRIGNAWHGVQVQVRSRGA